MDNHYVITISREFASLGRSIAQLTAKELGIYYMDRDIVEETAKRLGLPVSEIGESEERVSNRFLYRKFPLGRAPKTLEDEIFQVQSNIIQDTAASRDCIIVGRCAESVLRNRTRRLSIYIRAPYEARLRNCIESLEMDYSTAERMIHDVDLADVGKVPRRTLVLALVVAGAGRCAALSERHLTREVGLRGIAKHIVAEAGIVDARCVVNRPSCTVAGEEVVVEVIGIKTHLVLIIPIVVILLCGL